MNKRLVKFIFAWPMNHISVDLKLISYGTDLKYSKWHFSLVVLNHLGIFIYIVDHLAPILRLNKVIKSRKRVCII